MRKLLVVLAVLVALPVLAVLVAIVWPQVLPPTVPSPWAPLSAHPLRGGAYWVRGGVSNTGFIVGKGGVIIIDAQFFSLTAKRELAAIADITPDPVNAIIITHSDPDHVNGLPVFPRGLPIIAHENTRSDMLAALANHQTRWISRPSPAMKDYLPTQLVRDRFDLDIDGVHLVLLHFDKRRLFR